MFSATGPLVIDFNGDNDSFVDMSTGGMMALLGDADDSLADFLTLVSGTDAIRYWDGSSWDSLTNAVNGVDYTLQYQTSGDLASYTVLTVGSVPEPMTLTLLGLGAMLLRKRR